MSAGARWAAAVVAAIAGLAARADGPPDPEAKARAYFTDTVLLTHEGKEVRFYSDVLKDRVVAIDFVFARCEYACPLLTEKLNRVREELGPLFGKEVFFVSISVDPKSDTPQELARFAKKHGGLRDGWTWLTGPKADVDVVLKRLGEYVDDPESHTTAFILGNTRTRHWTKMRPEAAAIATAERLKALAAESAASASAEPARAAARPD